MLDWRLWGLETVEDELIVSGEAKLTPGCRSITERLWERGGREGSVGWFRRSQRMIDVVKDGPSVVVGSRATFF